MTMSDQPEIEPLDQAVAKLEAQLGVEPGFMLSLLNAPSDWAFVIQTAAFMEGALSHLIVQAIGRTELLDAIAHVEMANRKAGKIQIARALGVLDDDQARFLYALAELRNDRVHNIREVSFSLPNYTKGLTKDALKAFTKKFNAFDTQSPETTSLSGDTIPMTQYFQENPRLAIWNSAMTVAGLIYGQVDLARAKRASDDAAIATAKALIDIASSLHGSARIAVSASGTLN